MNKFHATEQIKQTTKDGRQKFASLFLLLAEVFFAPTSFSLNIFGLNTLLNFKSFVNMTLIALDSRKILGIILQEFPRPIIECI